MPNPTAAHEHWNAHAAIYRQLAKATKNSDVHTVVGHLAGVCSEMAKATDPHHPALKADLWIHPHDIVREATAQRWRTREAQYRALAANSKMDDDVPWAAVADRCAELAKVLEWSATLKINAEREKAQAPVLRLKPWPRVRGGARGPRRAGPHAEFL